MDCIKIEKDSLNSAYINGDKQNRYFIEMLDSVRNSSVEDAIDLIP